MTPPTPASSRSRGRAAALAAALAVLLVGAGCSDGSSDGGEQAAAPSTAAASPTVTAAPTLADLLGEGTATEVLRAATEAASAAESVRVEGDITTGGTQVGIDIAMQGDTAASGVVTMDGQQLEFSRDGETVYVRAGREFWAAFAGDQVAALVADTWLQVPAEQAGFAEFLTFTSLDSLVEQLLQAGTSVEKARTGEVDGVPAQALRLDTADRRALLWVASEGTPYPLRLEADGTGADEGAITFSGWDEPVDIVVPDASEVLDLSSLGAGGTGPGGS